MQQFPETASGGAALSVCFESASPVICMQEGLSCQSCTSASARHLSRVCRGLQDRAIKHLFMTIYPSPGCAPMINDFVESYRKSA